MKKLIITAAIGLGLGLSGCSPVTVPPANKGKFLTPQELPTRNLTIW